MTLSLDFSFDEKAQVEVKEESGSEEADYGAQPQGIWSNNQESESGSETETDSEREESDSQARSESTTQLDLLPASLFQVCLVNCSLSNSIEGEGGNRLEPMSLE
jgi:hypothetical protein